MLRLFDAAWENLQPDLSQMADKANDNEKKPQLTVEITTLATEFSEDKRKSPTPECGNLGIR
ncbi:MULTISPECIES: hypothetical protein [unclassified Endozoicomonas]|uniref:hypothetical protein n=1 Tax=unclassified Endozoicomonas TaxID=2644528 RepID=UPI002147A45A|nr:MULTISPECIES: hypothetical protein [unclassified Endozoicomonas]